MTAARKPANAPTQTRDAFAKVLAHYACAWCGVVTHADVLEDVEGDRVCPACADAEHREQEAREGDGRPVAMSESEEW
jgi:rubrerythrin